MDPIALNIRHLGAVAAIVKGGSISKAARAVNLTQPAITQGIAKLERQLGLPLFERRPGGMLPTEAATLLAARAEAALRLIGNAHATAAQIRAFVALARGGSYAAAAAETGLAEASLHRAVADLSLVMGNRLVDRRGRGVALTRRGIVVARHFSLALTELRSGIAELAALQGREVDRIMIGAMPLSRARLLPNAVAAFHGAHPQVDIAIAEGSHVELVGPLRDGEIDMMVGALRDPSPGDDLRQMPLFADRPVIIARPDHPLVGRDPLGPADLTGFPWIVPGEGTPLRDLWRRMFAATGVDAPHVPIESGSVMTVRQLLIGSDFLTLLSPDQVAMELRAGWLVKIADAPGELSRMIGVTTRADWRPTPMQDRFLDELWEQAKMVAGHQTS
jgi:LysR family transcriptional regulator of gallate degradation